MKKINTTLFYFIFIFIYSQVGINTKKPLGVLHIDGNSDNSDSPQLTTSQQLNDVIVTNRGYLGIGTAEPDYNLEAMGTIAFPDVPKNSVVGPYSAIGINNESGSLGVYTPGASPISIRTSKIVKLISTNRSSPTVLPIISDSSGESIVNTAGITYNDTDNYVKFAEAGVYRIEINIFGLCDSSTNATGLNVLYQLASSSTTNFADLNESRILVLNSDGMSYPGFSTYVKNFAKGDKIKLSIYRSVGPGTSCKVSLPTNGDFSNQIIITKL